MFEKKRGTRFLASVMALVMLLSLAPVGALAAGETPTNEECSAMPLPANEDNPKPVVTDEENTENTNEEPTPPPRNEGDAGTPADNNDAPVALPETPVIVKPAEGLIDEAFGVNTDTSDNGIADYKGGGPGGGNQGKPVEQPEAVTSITAEYWVTNGRASVDGNQSMVINSADFSDNQEKSISEIAPGEGAFPGDQKAVFRFAKVLSGNQKQKEYQEDRTSDTYGKKVESIRYSSTQGFQYKATDGNWYTFNRRNDQLVFYYLIKTNFVKDISVYITDWPTVEETDQSKYQVNYKVWELPNKDSALTAATLLEGPVKTYYNKDMTVSVIKVAMNDSEQYFVHKVTVDSKNNENESELTANDSEVTFSLNLANADSLAERNEITINIYVTAYKYQLNYEANGGNINDSNYSEAGSYLPNAPIIAPMNVTKTGYTFAGWYTDEECTEENKWTDSTDSKMPSKNLTLYAKWNKNSYTVTYKDGDAQSNGVDTVEYNSQVRVRPGLTKEGHIFKGWKSDADNTTYSPDQTFTMPAQNVTLTAQWTKTDPPVVPSNLVKAKFFINLGGKDASKPDGTGTFTKGIEIKDAINLDVFNPNKANGSKYGNNGYIFNNNGVKTQYPSLLNKEPTFEQINEKIPADKKESMSVGKGTGREVVWYHVSSCGDGYHVDGYIKNVAITITYDPNGGSFGDGVTIVEGKHTEPGTTGTPHQIISDIPQKAGYTFTGWKLKGSDDIYQPNGSITPTGDVTLVAQWSSNTVTLTYHENFGEKHTYAISVDKDSTQTVQSYAELRRLYGVFGENTGFYFDKWNTQADGKGNSHTVGSTISMTGSIDLYAQWKQARVPYTINQHFINEKNQEITTLANSQYKSAEQGTVLDTLITKTLKENKKDSENNVYVYIADKTTFKVGTTKVESTVRLSSKDTVIDLYYYLDKWKDTDEAGKDSENGGDGIPDCDQVLIKYVSSNSDRGTVSPDMEVLTIRKDNETVTPTANGSTATRIGSSRNYFSNWTKDNTQVSTNATLNHQTILEVIKEFTGGKTYTFTANFGRSSGGSNRPKPPVVEIPDDVPTGLNGKDHYAYIIGYGNNDVRPQNNITRAEVATIFFRMLTDESREQLWSQSNPYADVAPNMWCNAAVSTMTVGGIVQGYPDGSFRPRANITRAEFAAMAVRFFDVEYDGPDMFSDTTRHWASDLINKAASAGIILGFTDGTFRPDQDITRAEAIAIFNRVLGRAPDKDHLLPDMITWPDNMDTNAWYYANMQEATNSHDYDRVKAADGTEYEVWTKLLLVRDWAAFETEWATAGSAKNPGDIFSSN